jgi:predicted ATP-dependent endonuclease of OLD family
MHFKKAKICGHHIIKNSGWFEFPPNLTIFGGSCGSGKTLLLRGLQSINPHPLQQYDNPFTTFPDFFFSKGHKRKINPREKTAALAIFTCSDDLRTKLAEIDPILIETNKIEVGRRIDWSRWTSFIEIASSTRWSEVSAAFAALNHTITNKSAVTGFKTEAPHISNMVATDRIRGENMHSLANWLIAIQPHLTAEGIDLSNKTLHSVYRHQRFQAAKQVITAQLPSLLYLASDLLLKERFSVKRLLAQHHNSSSTIEESTEYCLSQHLVDQDSTLSPKRLRNLVDEINKKLQALSPDITNRLSHSLQGDTLTFHQKSLTGQQLPLNQAKDPFRWIVTLCLFLQASAKDTTPETILLLDEPEKNLTNANLQEFNEFIRKLSQQITIFWATGSSKILKTADLDTIRLLVAGDNETGTSIRPLLNQEEIDNVFEEKPLGHISNPSGVQRRD